MAHTVAEPGVLAVMDDVVVDMMAVAVAEKDGRMPKAGEVAIVDFQLAVACDDAVLCREFVIIVPAASLGEAAAMVVEVSLGVWPADAQAGDAYTFSHDLEQDSPFQR